MNNFLKEACARNSFLADVRAFAIKEHGEQKREYIWVRNYQHTWEGQCQNGGSRWDYGSTWKKIRGVYRPFEWVMKTFAGRISEISISLSPAFSDKPQLQIARALLLQRCPNILRYPYRRGLCNEFDQGHHIRPTKPQSRR